MAIKIEYRIPKYILKFLIEFKIKIKKIIKIQHEIKIIPVIAPYLDCDGFRTTLARFFEINNSDLVGMKQDFLNCQYNL